MKKVNILYTSHTSKFQMGGQVSLFNLVKRLNRDRYRPILLCPSVGDLSRHFDDIECPAVYHHFFRLKGFNLLRIITCIIHTIRLLREYNIDLIHSDHPVDAFYLGICSRLLRIPLVWHVRVSYSSRLDLINLRLASKVIGVSEAVSERFLRKGSISRKYITIYNGVDCVKFKPMSLNRLREELGLTLNSKIVATIGQITFEKGIDDFIEAIRILHGKINSCDFLIIGSGHSTVIKEIKAKIESYGLDEYVHLLGFRNDIINVLQGIDLFVLASWRYVEGLPRVVIEAMACGRPVVGTDVEGVNEAIENNTTGLLVPPKDPIRLSEAILETLMDKGRMEAMGKAGRKRAENMFSIIHNVDRIECVYQEVLTCRNAL